MPLSLKEWDPRSCSTNDIENFFSMMKSTMRKDGRGQRCASAAEVDVALKKALFIHDQRCKLPDN